ncbi:hypothetical protein V2J09_024132 [Rumex salicifolius]
MMKLVITFLIVAYTWNSVQPQAIPDPIQAICAQATNPQTCITKVRADPRENLKTTPEGAATILVDNAKANVKDTIVFIKGHISEAKDPDVIEKMKSCLQAYQQVGKDIKLKKKQLKTPEDREDAVMVIDTAESDISYDCGWQQLKVRTPVIDQLNERVNSLSDSVNSATAILNAAST